MKRKHNKSPPLPVAYCAFHEELVGYSFIRKRGCVINRFCRRLWWLDAKGNIVQRMKPYKKGESTD